ncbi:MAG: LPS export ABC transporter permease LptG [Alphaproteobacteria bacterium]|nr:LPS export ABC transporter permease LptG [Alphaproteobacteria bacterium]
MRILPTLSIYIARQFIAHFLMVMGLFAFLILVFDTVELLRRAAGRPNIGLSTIAEMVILKSPHMVQLTFPFTALFASILTFWRLTRSHELIVTRSAGVSAWQFLLPVLAVTFALGVFRVTAVNPVSAMMLSRYEYLDNSFLRTSGSEMAIAGGGVWLRQSGKDGQIVLHSSTIKLRGPAVELHPVIVFLYRGNDKFMGRMDAERAVLKSGYWEMENVWRSRPEEPSIFLERDQLPTDLTLARIQDSFAAPETMSFWDMAEFIDSLRQAGFSALRHRLHWQALFAAPFLMMAMVLLAAVFTLRHVRQGGTTTIIALGVMTGFLVYFFSDVSFALGLSSSIPLVLAAWTPAGVTTLIGVALLLHLEDG